MEDNIQYFSNGIDFEAMDMKKIDLQCLEEDWRNKDPTTLLKEKVQIITRAYIKINI